jgi:hypothetical protein
MEKIKITKSVKATTDRLEAFIDTLDERRLVNTIRSAVSTIAFYGHYDNQRPWMPESIDKVYVQYGIEHGQNGYSSESFRFQFIWKNGEMEYANCYLYEGIDRDDWDSYGSGMSWGRGHDDKPSQYGEYFEAKTDFLDVTPKNWYFGKEKK